jgi:glutaredoxin
MVTLLPVPRGVSRFRRSGLPALLALLVALLVPAVARAAVPAAAAEPAAATVAVPEASAEIHVYYFWGDGCPVCVQQRAYLDWLVEHHPTVEVHAFEVWREAANRPLLMALSDAFGQPVTGVPVTFIGEHAWVGFSQVAALQMTATVEAYLAHLEPPDALDRLPPELRAALLPDPPAAR